jgi:hypothetical protein
MRKKKDRLKKLKKNLRLKNEKHRPKEMLKLKLTQRSFKLN